MNVVTESANLEPTANVMGVEHASANDSANVQTFLEQLFEQGLLIPSDVDGLYGRGAKFERLVDAISDLIGAWGIEHGAEVMRFPPAMSRTLLEQSGYQIGRAHV